MIADSLLYRSNGQRAAKIKRLHRNNLKKESGKHRLTIFPCLPEHSEAYADDLGGESDELKPVKHFLGGTSKKKHT